MMRNTVRLLQRGERLVAALSARLARIAEIIEAADCRCFEAADCRRAAADGPVTPTMREMTQRELSDIYALAKGK